MGTCNKGGTLPALGNLEICCKAVYADDLIVTVKEEAGM